MTTASGPSGEQPAPEDALANGAAEANEAVAGFGTGDGDGRTSNEAAVEGSGPAEPEVVAAEDLVAELERVSIERDEYLDSLRRLQAEFENYRKAVAGREADALSRANVSLVNALLPILDACDGAVANGANEVEPIRSALLDGLAKEGLERLDPVDAPFDPAQHEAVMHEESSDSDGPVVAEVLRVGYGWKGNIVRPVMVKVRG